MTLTDQLKAQGIIDSEHIGDGAYVGLTAEGVALFTTNGIDITRPIFLDRYGILSLKNHLQSKAVI